MRRSLAFAGLIVLAACAGDTPTSQKPHFTVEVSVPTATLEVGQGEQLTAIVRTAAGASLPGAVVSWSTSDPSLASVDQGGYLTARAAGAVTVTAASAGDSASAQVQVIPATVATLEVSAPSSEVEIGGSLQLAAVLKDARGGLISGRGVTWSSSDPAVAAVNSAGQVAGIAWGKAAVVAEAGGKRDSLIVSVLPQTGLELKLSSPIQASNYVVAVDGGSFAKAYIVLDSVAPSTTPVLRIGVAAGGPYRVRVLAADPRVPFRQLMTASGKSDGVTIVPGRRTALAIALAQPTVTITAPSSVKPGASVAVTWTFNDPADALDIMPTSRGPEGELEYGTSPFHDFDRPAFAGGWGTKIAAGQYQYKATFVAPFMPGTIYYQVSAETIYNPWDADGQATAKPPSGYPPVSSFVEPSTARGAALATIAIQ